MCETFLLYFFYIQECRRVMESNGEYGYRKSTSGGALAGSPQLSDVAQLQRCSIETTERFTNVTSAIHSTDLKSMYCKKRAFNPKPGLFNQGFRWFPGS